MSLSIVLRPAAQEEFDEAVDWYEQKSAGLGVEFLNRVEEALDRIIDLKDIGRSSFSTQSRTKHVLPSSACPKIHKSSTSLTQKFPPSCEFHLE